MKLDTAINLLAAFCGVRDIPALTSTDLKQTYEFEQADVIVFFGGSILAGADEFAKALQQKIAKKAIIVGGIGHTTATLRHQIALHQPTISTTEQTTEAELFNAYLNKCYHLQADFLETKSTNCGNNCTNLLTLLAEQELAADSLILMQDATMQRRMAATLRNHLTTDHTLINYASYQVTVSQKAGTLQFDQTLPGMWTMERYISLLLGEIPRLRNDQNGYGPNGKNYLTAVTIPTEVETAFTTLQAAFPQLVRKADVKFKSSL